MVDRKAKHRKGTFASQISNRTEPGDEDRMVMVDVSDKPEVLREATASGIIKLKPETLEMVKDGKIAKGDPLYTSKIAAILAAKNTSNLIPLCHLLSISKVEVHTRILDKSRIQVTATVKAKARTGVEMEALTAATVALLTIWDMVKQYEKDSEGQYPTTAILDVHVLRKVKGASDK